MLPCLFILCWSLQKGGSPKVGKARLSASFLSFCDVCSGSEGACRNTIRVEGEKETEGGNKKGMGKNGRGALMRLLLPKTWFLTEYAR